jgi:hypothetical protein
MGDLSKTSGRKLPRKRAGPYQARAGLMALDRRSREAKFAAQVRASLIEHVGGNPSAPQMLLIQLASLRALRIGLLASKLETDSWTEHDDRHLNATANSLRADLQALGMREPERQIPSIEQYLIGRKRRAA